MESEEWAWAWLGFRVESMQSDTSGCAPGVRSEAGEEATRDRYDRGATILAGSTHLQDLSRASASASLATLVADFAQWRGLIPRSAAKPFTSE